MDKERSLEKSFVSIEKDQKDTLIKFDATENAVKFGESAKEVSGNIARVTDNAALFANSIAKMGDIIGRISDNKRLTNESNNDTRKAIEEIHTSYQAFCKNIDAETKIRIEEIKSEVALFEKRTHEYSIRDAQRELIEQMRKLRSIDIMKLDEKHIDSYNMLIMFCMKAMDDINKILLGH